MADLKAYDGVDSATKAGGDSVGPETEGREEGREGGEERETRSLLPHHHTRPHTRQVHTSTLGEEMRKGVEEVGDAYTFC